MNISTEERFWRHVDKSSDCWVWTGYRHHRDGYGHFKLDRKPVRAHRMSYEFEHGKIPEGMNVCHRCDNPPCVRPDHLFLGDQSVNLKDAYEKGRLKGFQKGNLLAKKTSSSSYTEVIGKR
jgi:hypothetical protein